MLTRSEYEKLCSYSGEFEYPYFFQTDYTDPGSLRCHAQLRNSQTTGILEEELEYDNKLTFNQGIFIDIFPLDNVPIADKKYKKLIKKLIFEHQKMLAYRDFYFDTNYFYKSLNATNGLKGLVKKLYFNILKLFWSKGEYINKYYRNFENIGKSFNSTDLEFVWTPVFFGFSFKKSVLGNPKYKKFEFIEVPIPERYDEYLTETYGDWHKFVKGASSHGGTIFNVNMSYREYLRKYFCQDD